MDALEIMKKHPAEVLYLRVARAEIDIFNKILEGYDNLAVVTTVDAAAGKIALWLTDDTRPAVLKIIKKMPCKVELWADVVAEPLQTGVCGE